MADVTTSVSRNDLQRILDACVGGQLGVTFRDDGVVVADGRFGGLSLTIHRPAESVDLPAPAVDVATLSGFETVPPAPVVEVPAPAPEGPPAPPAPAEADPAS